MEKESYITCPYCGTEYHAAEIYYPKHFFGKPEDIERTYDGKIKDHYGKPMNLKEEYTCDYCNKKFHVGAIIKFQTYKDDAYDFDECYSSPVKVKKFALLED